ncbi:RNA 2',3'-cyclic phosphodiesterase [Arenimonas oryziterrae]|uniref:RNA 2',3'-cyclic phosphodiesterase n=1 Tax=Arenimonas oryziterrae DSM 21050 = YC6267 TaxID=1121015 RepID=A0A091ANT4_9GAMM|nr:RNA 2',3'-cyclic phosphodiesterase [Arenimonas oryziterrae]KFN41016.1 hypothetical protein N789_03800 [Arenimonas oryziterrae DSM 21050 = YC6267]
MPPIHSRWTHAAQQPGLFGVEAARPIHRLFFALFPDAAASERIERVAEELRPTLSSRCQWVRPERRHLTLHFLGEYDPLAADQVAAASAAADSLDPVSFDVRLDALGSFPGRRPPCVLRSLSGDAPLRHLWKELHHALVHAGFAAQLSAIFEPHVTLCYGDREAVPRAIAPISWRAHELRLVHSLADEQAYRELARWPLA